ncbi:MAG: TatD family hydrolase [bacterium]
MIDTHAHIDFEAFDEDRSDMIQRAFDNGVEYIIIPGVEPKNFEKLLGLTETNDRLFCGMGVHPHNALDADDEVFKKIIGNTANEKVKAIGETGIDYFYDFAPKDVQKNVFRKHLHIAKETGLPVIVHNRDADDDVLGIIKEEQNGSLKGVLHCFSSPLETMEKALDLGFNISFTGNITFKKSQLDEVIEKTPLDSIMLETDSPFMTPVPNRGKRNEPANVKFIAQKIATIKSISIDEVIAMTSKTAKLFFKLSMLIVTLLFSGSIVFSQSVLKDIEKEKIPDEELIHPFPKFIGFGPVAAPNTVVETYYLTVGEPDPSYDGLPAYGGSISYGVFDNLVAEVTYIYSKNEKIARDNPGIAPSIYNMIEFSTHWILNPYSRINFYGTLGITSFFNSHNNVPSEQIGWNWGLGMYINVNTDYGLFVLSGEWKLNYETEKTLKNNVFIKKFPQDKREFVDTRSYYSLPRATLIYFPPFKKWFGLSSE